MPIKKPLFFLVGAAAMRPSFRAKKQETICKRKKLCEQRHSMHDQTRDAAEYDEASYTPDFFSFDDPYDTSENFFEDPGAVRGVRITAYREASEKLLVVLNKTISFLAEHGYSRSKTLWGVAFALGHPLTAGMSMLEAGRELGCTKQAISKIAMDFLDTTGLPPSTSLKSEEARNTYRKTNTNKYGTKRNNIDNPASH
jgi:hypothetical protein